MKLRQILGLLVGIVLAVTAAQAQTNVRVRGTVRLQEVGKVSVTTGSQLNDQLPALTVAVAKAIPSTIKQGDYIGSTTTLTDRTQVAIQVHIWHRRCEAKARTFSPDRR
jgi:hypothetical protein